MKKRLITVVLSLLFVAPAYANTKQELTNYFETFYPRHLNTMLDNKLLLLALLKGEKVDKSTLSRAKFKIKYLDEKLKEPCNSNISSYPEVGVVISAYLDMSLSNYHSLIKCIDYQAISDLDVYYPELSSFYMLDRKQDGFNDRFNNLTRCIIQILKKRVTKAYWLI